MMPHNLEALLVQHTAAQGTAHHFDGVNWILHAIMIPANGYLSIFILSQMLEDAKPNLLHLGIYCFAGLILTMAWRQVFKRHDFMIKVMYDLLHQIENDIGTKTSGEEGTFLVHRALAEADRQKIIEGKMIGTTRMVMLGLQHMFLVNFLVGFVGFMVFYWI